MKYGNIFHFSFMGKIVGKTGKVLDIKVDRDSAGNNHENVLGDLEKYTQEITSYDKTLEIKPDIDVAWLFRGLALGKLGRLEEAIASYDKVLKLNPDKYCY